MGKKGAFLGALFYFWRKQSALTLYLHYRLDFSKQTYECQTPRRQFPAGGKRFGVRCEYKGLHPLTRRYEDQLHCADETGQAHHNAGNCTAKAAGQLEFH